MIENPELQHWNARFAGDEYAFGTEPNAFLASQKHRLHAGQTALAIADGEGRNGVWLARQGLDVVSLDFSPVANAKARRLAAQHGVTLQVECGDLTTWDSGGRHFDLVVGIFFQFAPPAKRTKIFAMMQNVLNPDGLILLEGYRPEQLEFRTGGPSEIENLYTEDLLREAFADLEILYLEAYDALVQEGARHSGMSALIDLVARKKR